MTNFSLRFTVVSLFQDMPTTRTEYIHGANFRSESSGHSTRACIVNRDLGYSFQLEPGRRVYSASRLSRTSKPQSIESEKSGRIIHDHTDTIDTGERKEIFGYVARRILTSNRQTSDSQVLTESECDGWYIDPPAAWLNIYPPPPAGIFYRLSISSTHKSAQRDDYKFTETGRRETGFIMRITRTHRSFSRDEAGNARVHESIHREEVSEFSETPLAPDLFVPPRDFKRVPQLADSAGQRLAYRLWLRWKMWEDSLSLPHRIARFNAP